MLQFVMSSEINSSETSGFSSRMDRNGTRIVCFSYDLSGHCFDTDISC